jgi:apolipoprotein N-acyltransferase
VACRVSNRISVWLGQFVPGLFWITESFQVEADRFGWLALPAVFGLAALLAVFPAFACALAARMARAGLPLSLSLATSWTGLEWLRGHVLTGFPWNLAAYTLADWLPLAQMASLVGSYGLGFLLVLCSALVGLAFRAPARRLQVIRFASATAIAVTVAGFGFARLTLSDPPSERGTQIRVVQPNIAQSAKWDEGSRKANILRLLALSARPGDYDILLWPETAWPGFLAEDTGARIMLGWLLPKTAVLLAGSPEREVTSNETVYRNSVLAIAPDGSVLTRYAKHHLVPFGEYVPWRSVLPFQRLVESLGDFLPGPGPRTLAFGPHPYAGIAICYEIIFPGHVVDDAIRPDWIFNATNDAWFGSLDWSKATSGFSPDAGHRRGASTRAGRKYGNFGGGRCLRRDTGDAGHRDFWRNRHALAEIPATDPLRPSWRLVRASPYPWLLGGFRGFWVWRHRKTVLKGSQK